jgi:hypothetical protein
MIDANMSKFGQIKKSVELTEKHCKVIDSLPGSVARTYLLEKGRLLRRVYIQGLIECMGPNKYEQSAHDERILGLGIPKYLELKFNDPNFTKDAKNDAHPLLFPRGNYLKALSFQTREIASDGFLNANQAVIAKSHSIIQLARSDELRDWFIPMNHTSRDELISQWEKFNWPLLSPGDIEYFLKPRMDRVNVKSFTPTMAPKQRPGQKGYRPETNLQREVRDLRNTQSKLMSLILDFFHLIPRVDDPLQDFWQKFCLTENWVITPDKAIYDWLNEATNRDTLVTHMTNNSLAILRRAMAEIIGLHLSIPLSSARFVQLREILMNTGDNTTTVFYTDDPPVAQFERNLNNLTKAEVEDTAGLTAGVREQVKVFRGKATEDLLKSERSKMIVGKKKLSKTAARFLRGITDPELNESIEKWIRENFRNKKLQNIAAEYAAMAIDDENLGYVDSEDESLDSDEESEG